MIVAEIDFMTPADLDEVIQIEQESFSSPWSLEMFREELRKGEGVFYIVARLKNRVVGYGGIYIIDREAHITTIAVAKAYRGHRIGEQLLVALIEIAKYSSCKRVVLEVRISNVIAINLYKKYHFKVVKLIHGYYRDNGEDAAFMALTL